MELERLKKAAESGIAPFAFTTYRNKPRIFGIKADDRRRHVYIVGKTGMGKTTLMENMVYSDIVAGHGLCYIDPHGDTAEKMLEWIPAERINDVIYFNPADLDHPISFNVLEKVDPKLRHLVSSGLIGVFKKLWADSWGPRLEYILRNAILALLEYPDSTLLGINRMLVDKSYRKKVVEKITDPVVKSFWVDEFPRWNERVMQEVVSPIQNKVGQFLSTALIRNVVGQVKSSINLREVMDSGKILILNLAKGRVGEDASALFGAMMVTKLYLAAMSRVDIKEEERKDFYLYVDEFQNFATDSFKDILSEARKYRLNLIIGHQYIEQLGEVVQPAVFGNVGTIICFRIGAADAEFLEKEFAPNIFQQDLVNLPKFNIYLKLMIDGVASDPFSAQGLPPVYGDSLGNEEKVIKVSRERYAKPVDVVEDKIRRWSLSQVERDKLKAQEREAGETVDKTKKNQKFLPQPVKKEAKPFVKQNSNFQAPQPQKTYFKAPVTQKKEPETRKSNEKNKKLDDRPLFPAVCYGCKKDVQVPFKPDLSRPVFCKDCLKKARRGQIPVRANEQIVEKDEISKPMSLSEMSKKTVDFKGKMIDANDVYLKDSGINKRTKEIRQEVPQKIVKEDVVAKKFLPEKKPVVKKVDQPLPKVSFLPEDDSFEENKGESKPRPISSGVDLLTKADDQSQAKKEDDSKNVKAGEVVEL